jgi:phospholipase C
VKKLTFVLIAATATLVLSACGGSSSALSSLPSAVGSAHSAHVRGFSGSTPIQHVVLIIQENRTYNNLFATFPGGQGATYGYECVSGHDQRIDLKETALQGQHNLNHGYDGFSTAYDNGNMDCFNQVKYPSGSRLEGTAPYVYVDPNDIAPYWSIAKQWGLADELFTTQGSASFPAHQDLIRGGTCISSQTACENPSEYSVSLIDNPPYGRAWGCDSAPGTTTSLITNGLDLERATGPFPCTNQFPYYPYTYETLRDLLDAKSVSWKYYAPKIGTSGAIWSAYDVIAPVRYGSEWTNNVSSPETNIFNDISNGNLADMSWIVPDAENSDHPGEKCKCDYGPSWVASLVNAIGESKYWDSTAIIIVWDDWGGFYDPVAPPLPRDNQGGPGLRVPMLVVSPYTKLGDGSQGGYISNTSYRFGSILRFIEDNFDLGRLGTTDGTSTSMADMFNFDQSPRGFKSISSTYKRAFFMHKKPSGIAPDEQ